MTETAEVLGISKGRRRPGIPGPWPDSASCSTSIGTRRSDEHDTARTRLRQPHHPAFNALVEELVNKLQAGEAVNLDDYRLRHPEQAEKLDKLLPAMAMMANLGWSVNPPAPPAPAPNPNRLATRREILESWATSA